MSLRQRFEANELSQTLLENLEPLSQGYALVRQETSRTPVAFGDGVKQFVLLPRHNPEPNAEQPSSVDKPELFGDVASHDVVPNVRDMLRE